MKMYIELYASLMHLLPPGKRRHKREIKVNKNAVVQDVIDEFNIPPELAHIVLVNGIFVCDNRDKHELVEGDIISIWPPVAGG